MKILRGIRKGVWTLPAKKFLVEQVYDLLVCWKGKKAEKTDRGIQVAEIEDSKCVFRYGRWGMREGGDLPGDEWVGRSVPLGSERTLVG